MTKEPCEAWRFIGVPKTKCQECGCWFIDDTQYPEFCSDKCYARFSATFDLDSETLGYA